MSHFATQSATGRSARALALTTCLVLFSPAEPGVAQQSESERLQAEIEEQQALLDQLQRRHAAVQESDPEADPAPLLDARAAPSAPPLRDLPLAIFDETNETIAEGAWGNPDRMRVRRLSLDADGDGQPELIRYLSPESGLLLRQEKDRN